METPIQLIAGLGNPGAKYEQTRHNIGAEFVAALAKQQAVELKEERKFSGAIGKATIKGWPVWLLIPSTFMNLSGKSVGAIANFYNIPPEAILVVHDELDFAPGKIKLKLGGGHGGHNGLRDIIQALGNRNNFARLRIGIGHPGHASQVTAYVLKKAPAEERQLLEQSIDKALPIMDYLATGEWNAAMKALHT